MREGWFSIMGSSESSHRSGKEGLAQRGYHDLRRTYLLYAL
jgi:hypothetical protein